MYGGVRKVGGGGGGGGGGFPHASIVYSIHVLTTNTISDFCLVSWINDHTLK